MVFGLILILILVIALGEPLYVLIGGVAAFLLLASGEVAGFSDLTQIIEMTRKLSDNEVLLAIPFFVISGALMSEGQIAHRLINVARAMFCWMPGGLAVSAVFACIFFAAISGSSPVTVIAIGSIMFPAMVREGYKQRFSAGIVTATGSLGILIPPSIPMIVYAIIDPMELEDPPNYQIANDASGLGLVELFLAGVAPGLMIGLMIAIYAIAQGKLSKTSISPFKFWDLIHAIREGIWSLLLPVIILGGIYSGVFTPTQAAAVSVIYALVVEFFIHRSLTNKDLPRVLGEATVLIGALLIIIALAQGFNKYLESAQIAEKAVEVLLQWELSPFMLLLMINILLLIVGFFMDILSAILILVPLLSPIAYQLGIHPIHLAIVFIVNLEIGYLTPPLGLNLFVASTIFRKSLGEIVRSVLPFIGIMLCGLIVVTYVPTVSLGPVALYKGTGFYVPFPERRIPLRAASVPESVLFLSGVAQREEELGEDQANRCPELPTGRAATMAELQEINRCRMDQEAMDSLLYDSVEALLEDYRLVHSRRVRLRDLAMMRELGLDLEDLTGDVLDDEEGDDERDESNEP